ncbi:MAG TPA: hypothetical protein DCL15_05250, partial [Chloroflexi bacterium]|nr:hypothetical protein [Chloroflexota bacterium]
MNVRSISTLSRLMAILIGAAVLGGCATVPLLATPTAQPREDATTSATAPLAGAVWIANEEGNSLTVVDAATNAVVTTLTGIPAPHNVQVSPDGRTVWVVSGHEGLAIAVDAQELSLLGVAPVGSAPAHVIVSPDGATAYVTNSGDNTVT